MTISVDPENALSDKGQLRLYTEINLLCRSEPNFYESYQVQGNENLMT